MDSALEKLGVYEFFTLFLTGIITETLVCIALDVCFCITLPADHNVACFLVLGYAAGLLLHELSWVIKKPLDKTIKPFKTDFTGDTDVFVNDADEKMAKQVIAYVLKDNRTNKNSDEYVASVCCNDLQVKGLFANAHGLQKESESAFSLAVAFGLLATLVIILAVVRAFMQLECRGFGIGFVLFFSVVFSALFYSRSKRMHKYYLRCLIRTYAVAHELTFVTLEKEENNHGTSQEPTAAPDHAHPGA